MNTLVAVIVSTYRNVVHLDRCLAGLACQDAPDFEIIIADDGSGEATRELINSWAGRLGVPMRHVWQADKGFRKTRVLNKAMTSTNADYLVFMDGDCVVHPGFVGEHLRKATPGHYLNGALIRLGEALTRRIDRGAIESGEVFRAPWLARAGRSCDRRYLRLALPYRTRSWFNAISPTELYWLGANSSCYREDAEAINGFDNRFGYGFEDGDFGNRLENLGIRPATVRWTAVALHLHHDKPWARESDMARHRQMMARKSANGRYWAEDGLRQVYSEPGPASIDRLKAL
jgi:glycosyltransferase involved in cell wall biosynthesis